ncbi:hypothetical protein IQ37_02080 [Chryseobacterium piperi]|uniref:PPC domain-containing protein n=1 Tax=Chryseobacterium piperi TaxID=558152 RepID=A0A086BM21_9FLAO|nr:PPC domain-containing DNA-binding protein [Chryseobacterium piperi]KFF29985.1 hypothetical protein IQ37_02080 [Chryseobacterium piperi]
MKILILKLYMVLLTTFITTNLFSQQNSKTEIPRFNKTSTGYIMVLREGDNVIAEIEKLAKSEKIPFASFSGIGFAGDVTFGFYDFDKKKFNPKTFRRVEMGNLTGSIAWNEKGPSIHVHGIATDDQFQAYGGHILSLHVGTGSIELYITLNNKKLDRNIEQPLNANVLQLNQEP